MFKALLFDLDGTLADTNSVHRLAWVDLLQPYGYDVTWDFYRENITGRVSDEVVADLLPGIPSEQVREMAEAKDANFRERSGALEPLPGLLDLVEKGRKKGMGISLVTNAPKENVFAVLRILGLGEAFEPVILADDIGAGKPDPAPYNAALGALDISADEAVAFEDSPSGIASSVAAGIPTVAVASTSEPEDLEGPGVELVVRDFSDPKLEAFIEGR
ncbi:MAG: HAD family phosphatase [Actinobacteria bacterium]|jgi:HAD superfamily hydrolase (TIGR01509 family)|nr:HAD family phosphatase [Actinomycetota bacterium]MCA1739772.1 HAD family phosphatase [Actinomycetota bacterium]